MAAQAGGKCKICETPLTIGFHADHCIPFSKGGQTTLANGQALCPACNTQKGAKMTQLKLRPWQEEALAKAVNWLLKGRKDRHFLINAAPGAGKTIAACAIAQYMIEHNEIDRIIVIAPRVEVVGQWADDFKNVTGRYMSKVTAGDGDISQLGIDVCATWAAVQGLSDAFQAICRTNRVLVICDEHHHAAVKASWGDGANSAFSEALFSVILTGTPIRSDGAESIWLAYDSEGAIDQPEEGSYSLTYGKAVEFGYCRPTTFHRHEGKFTVDLEGGEKVQVAGEKPPELTPELKRIPGLQAALDFYRLACTPQFKKDNKTPLRDGYQATMLEWGSKKLDELRYRMPEAGGLVIAPNIMMAEYMAKLIEEIEGEAPIIVHSQLSNPESRIKAFRNTNKRWLVSVAMVSEGVDIRRLRVLIYLPNALTELAFRQAVGRVVRTNAYDDDTRAYVVMPSFATFHEYARRVEEEMPAAYRGSGSKPKNKVCPTCKSECQLGDQECSTCGYEFPAPKQNFKPCPTCNGLNPMGAKSCNHCGQSFQTDFVLSLDEALRDGVIVRGMDINEEETIAGEKIAAHLKHRALASGDAKVINLINSLPEESYGRLKAILDG